MTCSRCRRALLDRDLGLLSAAGASVLREHLARCPRCAAEARSMDEMSLALSRTRGIVPPAVDVAARVMRRVSAVPAPSRDAVPLRQLGWIAVATATIGALLVAGAIDAAPELLGALARGDSTLALAGRTLRLMLGPVLGLFAVVGHLLLGLLDLLRSVGVLLAPLAAGSIAACAVAVLAAGTVVVARDLILGGAPLAATPKER